MCEIPALFQPDDSLITSLDSQQEVSQYTQLLLNDDILTPDLQVSLAQFVQQDLPILDVLAVDFTENNKNMTEIDQQQNRNLENEEKYEIVLNSEFHSWKQLDYYISTCKTKWLCNNNCWIRV
ncbi:hypothetical protein F8M41_010469 [Gigaspora margarita]|uniref:Uncharacterized protein n=1 Tax=Gigaspora margarita TaxID=4874 RepID=A0A8H4AUE3_GIGMA|nr:hypothetical protein F8M41_010469 [Gigaspora margarita]